MQVVYSKMPIKDKKPVNIILKLLIMPKKHQIIT